MTGELVGALLLWLIGIAVVVVIAVYILQWLYRRSTKETAFVRTGFLGEKVVVNSGAFVIPVLHEITPVNMNVLRIEVARRDGQALITKNRMRVDIAAEFFVRVGATKEAVASAAQTLGRRTLQEDGLRSLLEGKFASAMRTIAGTARRLCAACTRSGCPVPCRQWSGSGNRRRGGSRSDRVGILRSLQCV